MISKRLSVDFSIAGQIGAHDLTLVSSLGFRSVLCSRPDGEDSGQELFEMIQKAARSTGLEACYVPITSLPPTKQDVSNFTSAYNALPKPIFAYGDDGSRCEALFEAMNAQNDAEAK